MASILEGDMAAQLTDAITSAGLPYTITVTRITTSGPSYDPVQVETPHEGQGWRDNYSLDTVDGTLIRASDARVFILASTLAIAPTTADRVTLDGVTHSIVRVSIDPAGTAWDIQARA